MILYRLIEFRFGTKPSNMDGPPSRGFRGGGRGGPNMRGRGGFDMRGR